MTESETDDDRPGGGRWRVFLAYALGLGAIAGIFVWYAKQDPDFLPSVMEDIGIHIEHESEKGWWDAFSPERELAQFEGEWRPSAPGEEGCTWSIHAEHLTRRCKEETKGRTLEIEGPGILVAWDEGGMLSFGARYGYVRVGSQLYVGPAVVGRRLNGVIVVEDGIGRVVFRDGTCGVYRDSFMLGKRQGKLAHVATSLTCALENDAFRYQTTDVRPFQLRDAGEVWHDVEVAVKDDALFSPELLDWPLLPAADAN